MTSYANSVRVASGTLCAESYANSVRVVSGTHTYAKSYANSVRVLSGTLCAESYANSVRVWLGTKLCAKIYANLVGVHVLYSMMMRGLGLILGNIKATFKTRLFPVLSYITANFRNFFLRNSNISTLFLKKYFNVRAGRGHWGYFQAHLNRKCHSPRFCSFKSTSIDWHDL